MNQASTMLKNLHKQLLRLASQSRSPFQFKEKSRRYNYHQQTRGLATKDTNDTPPNSSSKDLVESSPKEIFAKEFPNYYSHEGFVGRSSYVDFIDEALARMKELGLHRNIEAYKELLRIFPPGKYNPGKWSFGLYHAPQQLCVARLLTQMEQSLIRPDKEVEKLVVGIFGKQSDAWYKIARMNYWSMKGRNVDRWPLPEVIPKKPHELAKVALHRMVDDVKSTIVVKNTSSLPDAIDKTWVVYVQSTVQQLIIENLPDDSILYLEEGGITYVDTHYLTYYTLKVYEDEEKTKQRFEPKPGFNYNTLKMQFYGKPIKKKLESMNDIHLSDNSHILAIGMTGTSSHDSLLSWLKMLQKRNPKLNKLSVVFRLKRPTHDVIDPETDPDLQEEKHQKQSSG